VFRRPFEPIHDRARRLDDLEVRLTRAARRRREQSQDALASLAARLESLSPLAVLGRGYSLTTRTETGQLLDNAAEVQVGEQITTRLAAGQLISRVEKATPRSGGEGGLR
jgi:exodeoxyribonuclease VII large subunit